MSRPGRLTRKATKPWALVAVAPTAAAACGGDTALPEGRWGPKQGQWGRDLKEMVLSAPLSHGRAFSISVACLQVEGHVLQPQEELLGELSTSR